MSLLQPGSHFVCKAPFQHEILTSAGVEHIRGLDIIKRWAESETHTCMQPHLTIGACHTLPLPSGTDPGLPHTLWCCCCVWGRRGRGSRRTPGQCALQVVLDLVRQHRLYGDMARVGRSTMQRLAKRSQCLVDSIDLVKQAMSLIQTICCLFFHEITPSWFGKSFQPTNISALLLWLACQRWSVLSCTMCLHTHPTTAGQRGEESPHTAFACGWTCMRWLDFIAACNGWCWGEIGVHDSNSVLWCSSHMLVENSARCGKVWWTLTRSDAAVYRCVATVYFPHWAYSVSLVSRMILVMPSAPDLASVISENLCKK